MKGVSAEAYNWTFRNQEFTFSEIRVSIKDRLYSSMQNELEDHQEDYRFLTHEYWCDLLSTIRVKYERKRVATQIKKIASARVASLSGNNESVKIPRKKKASTGVLHSNKGPQKKAHKYHGTQPYFVPCNKSGMPERKYIPHSVEDCTGQRTNQTIKDGMVEYVTRRPDTVKQYKNSENKWKIDLKYFKKQNKMLYIIAKKSVLRRGIKKIEKIHAKASNKSCDSSSNSSSEYSDSDSSLARDSS